MEIHDYQKHELLGKGKFARVYRATHKNTQQDVALKVIKIKESNYEDIQREIMIHKDIEHPNIIQFIGCFPYEKSTNILVMTLEYLRGSDLFDHFRKKENLQHHEIVNIFKQTVNAIVYLHDLRIIHRDIKLENIMISDNGNVKIVDFGFAVKCKHGEYRTTYCGTTEYLAPEIILNGKYNTCVDNWALGVLLYELICTYTPFHSHKSRKIIKNIACIQIKTPIEEITDSNEFRTILNGVFVRNIKKRMKSKEILAILNQIQDLTQDHTQDHTQDQDNIMTCSNPE